MNDWFTVDRAGLAKILRRRGIEFAVFELIQNAWDEKGVTRVEVTLESEESGRAILSVSDDAPDGFKDLSHSFTLFADSSKKVDPEKRGRFNLGEKLVLALCTEATISSTTGRVTFDGSGRKVRKGQDREAGTLAVLHLKMNRGEIDEVCAKVSTLIPPSTIATIFNGIELRYTEILSEFTATLPTEIADAEGALRPSKRQTIVRVYKPLAEDQAKIYEMGIPVVEHDCAFHVDVQQKVPVTLDRENVTPAFLRAMRTAVFNATHELVTPEQTTAEWAQTAIESPNAEPEAVADYMTKRFGEKRVSYDPSDPEANDNATSHGYTVIHGRMLSGAAWQNVRQFDAITPAGQMFPTHSKETLPFDAADITDGMREVESYAIRFARLVLDCDIIVRFGKQRTCEAASWGARSLQFNVPNLGGPQWFNLNTNRLAIDDLIIHEFGHHYESNHLSSRYHEALTNIAAKAVAAARENQI